MALLYLCSLTTEAVNLKCGIALFGLIRNVEACYIRLKEPLTLNRPDKIDFTFSSQKNLRNVKFFIMDASSNFSAASIPSEIFETFPNLEVLHFAANIGPFSRGDFIGANSLIKLKLSRGHLGRLPLNAFLLAPNLRRIDIENSDVHTIDNFAFDDLKKLQKLSLNDNRLKTIGRYTFATLLSLEGLDLSNNLIDTIADDAFNFPKLKCIFLSGNKLKTLPNSLFSSTPLLSHLYVVGSNVQRLNNAIYNLQDLELVQLDNNNIEDLDIVRFAKLSNLIKISLENSGFNLDRTNVSPNDINSSQANVREINLSKNQMENRVIFAKLKLFPKLEVVDVSNNRLTSMDLEEIRNGNLRSNLYIEIAGNSFNDTWLQQTARSLTMTLKGKNKIFVPFRVKNN